MPSRTSSARRVRFRWMESRNKSPVRRIRRSRSQRCPCRHRACALDRISWSGVAGSCVWSSSLVAIDHWRKMTSVGVSSATRSRPFPCRRNLGFTALAIGSDPGLRRSLSGRRRAYRPRVLDHLPQPAHPAVHRSWIHRSRRWLFRYGANVRCCRCWMPFHGLQKVAATARAGCRAHPSGVSAGTGCGTSGTRRSTHRNPLRTEPFDVPTQ